MNTIELSDEDVKRVRRILWFAYLKDHADVADAESYSALDDLFDNGKGYA